MHAGVKHVGAQHIEAEDPPSLLMRILLRLPLIGFALRSMSDPRPIVPVLFLVNFIMAGAVLVLMFGFPALITIALSMTALMFFFLIWTTLG